MRKILLLPCLMALILSSCTTGETCACTEIQMREVESPRELVVETESLKEVRSMTKWFQEISIDSALQIMRQEGQPLPGQVDPLLLRQGLSEDTTAKSSVITVRYCGQEEESIAINFLSAWLEAVNRQDIADRQKIYDSALGGIETEKKSLEREMAAITKEVESLKMRAGKDGSEYLKAMIQYDLFEKHYDFLLERETQLRIMKAYVTSRMIILAPADACEGGR